jgi:hypothetical protein
MASSISYPPSFLQREIGGRSESWFPRNEQQCDLGNVTFLADSMSLSIAAGTAEE